MYSLEQTVTTFQFKFAFIFLHLMQLDVLGHNIPILNFFFVISFKFIYLLLLMDH